MADMYDGSIKIDTLVETEKAEKSLKNLENTVKKAGGTLTESFDDVDDGTAKLVRDLDNLNARIEIHQTELEDLREKYQRVAQAQGESSPAALKLQKQILSTENAINKMTDTSDKMAQSLRKMDESEDDAAKSAKNLGDAAGKTAPNIKDVGNEAQKSKSGISTMRLAFADLIAKGIEKAISALGRLYSDMQEFNRDMSKLEMTGTLFDVLPETIDEATKSLFFLTGEMDSSIEAVSNLLNAGYDDNNLQEAIDNLSGAVIRFPDTLKIESLADSLQETLATGEATGQFSELLGRLGIKVETFEKGLAKATKRGEEQEYVMRILANRGLGDLYRKYAETNAAAKENADAQYEMNQVFAQLAKILMPIATVIMVKITQAIRNNMGAFQALGNIIYVVINAISGVLSILSLIDPRLLMIIAIIIMAVSVFTKMAQAVQSISGALGPLTGAMGPVGSKAMQITAIIIGVVIALAALAAIIAVIMGRSDDLGRTFDKIGDSTSKLSGQVSDVQSGRMPRGGRAQGSLSMPRGKYWVGENGPEVVDFKGGERVYTAQQSQALAASAGTPANVTNVYNVTIDAARVKEFNDVVRIAQNERASIRKGYVGR